MSSFNYDNSLDSKFNYGASDYSGGFSAAPPSVPQNAKKPAAVAKNATAFSLAEPKAQPLVAMPASPLATVAKQPPAKPSVNMDGWALDDAFGALGTVANKSSGIQQRMAAPLASQQLVQNQMNRGWSFELNGHQRFASISRKIQTKYLSEIDQTQARVKRKIEEYNTRTNELNKEFGDYAIEEFKSAKKEGYVVDDNKVATAKHLTALVTQVTNALYNSAKQLIELEGLNASK